MPLTAVTRGDGSYGAGAEARAALPDPLLARAGALVVPARGALVVEPELRDGARPAVRGSARPPDRELARGGGADVFPAMRARYPLSPRNPTRHTGSRAAGGFGRHRPRALCHRISGSSGPAAAGEGRAQMLTSEPNAFTERGDRAEAAAYHGDGAYSGGEFAGGDVERYDREEVDTDGSAPVRDPGPPGR